MTATSRRRPAAGPRARGRRGNRLEMVRCQLSVVRRSTSTPHATDNRQPTTGHGQRTTRMILSIIIIAVVAGVAYFHYAQGLFGATISATIAIIAAALAIGYHEN